MVSRRVSERGMTLIEILLATFILCAVVLPIGTLIFGGHRRSESSKSFNIGANLAADVMDKLLAHEIPFVSIEPQGGPAVSEVASASGLAEGADEVIDPGRRCAAFTADHTALEDKVFGSLGGRVTEVGGCKRVLENAGYVFEIYWFAGRYQDRVADQADLKSELTFSYFKNPYVPVGGAPSSLVVYQGGTGATDPYPYSRGAETATDALIGSITDPKDPRSRPGWPVLGNFAVEPTYEKVLGTAPSLEFPLVVTDLRDFNEPDGGLLKLIVGVRWGTKSGFERKGVGAQRRTSEFWLVAMKGRIEEG